MTNELKAFYQALVAFDRSVQCNTISDHLRECIEGLLQHTYSLLSKEEKELIDLVCNAEVHDIIYTR
jgi:hypothetical protein